MNSTLPEPSLQFKLVILGDFGVGKRSFIQFLKTGEFFDTSTYISRDPGAPIETIKFEINGKPATIFLFWNNWPVNNPPIPAIRQTYYKGTNGIILFYDITRRVTFEHLHDYVSDTAKFLKQRSIPIAILGNKCELNHERKVQLEEGQMLATKLGHNVLFTEISCRTGQGVKESLEKILQAI